ncbi:MAG: DUF1648 domain-containing protein [Candidatus Aminicenantes bacterium]|nr:DUF1648 domain-containing protein [Candidatus Aminicenantes bacterium]
MKKLYDLGNLVLLLLLGVFVYGAYGRLPARIPMHFGIDGRPDRWGGRGELVVLALVPFVMTAVFYLLIRFLPKMAADPRRMNIPHKEEFFRLPAEKREIYWDLVKEFFAGLTLSLNLLFYTLVRATVRIAEGGAALLPFRLMAPALALMAVMMIVYIRRMFTLPGKIIRGEV